MPTAHVVATDSNEKRIAGRYILGRPLGQGGMGIVAVAHDERLNRDVAIKLLSASAIGGAVMRARLIREARALAALSHPGVVHVYDVGETDDGGAYLVMELVQGTSLGVLLKKRTTSRGEWLRIMADTARTLGAAHRAGFVHRDVKPDNIMLRDDGRVVVLDFGIAQRLAAEGAGEGDEHAADDMLGRLTVEGTLVGTPGYLAPEQALGAPVDGRADQFALGVLLYRAVTGRAPWRGREFKELVAQIVHAMPTPPSVLVPGLPRELDAVVARALAKAPDARYPDMESLAAAIDEVIARGVPAGDVAEGSVDATMPLIESARPPPRSIAPRSAGHALASTPAPPPDDELPTVQSGRPPLPSGATPGTASPLVAPVRNVRGRRSAALAALALVLTASLLLGGFVWRVRHRVTGAAVLGARDATLACPLLETHDATGHTGWLGAAAGATVCARARWLFGGDGEHTLAPAALLQLPRHPADGFPRDPYVAPTARRASLEAAARASAYVDGDVACGNGWGCTVNLVVRLGAGREAGRATGHGAALYEAVRQAMDALGNAGALPRPRALAPDVAAWTRVQSPAAALALEDLALSRVQGGATAEECRRVLALGDAVRDVVRELRAACAADQGAPGVAPVDVDRASASALAHTAVAHIESGGHDDPVALATALQDAYGQERSRAGRTVLAQAAAQTWLLAGDAARAHNDALLSVELDPASNPAWASLASATAGLTSAGVTQRAYAAWFPESADAWTRASSAYDAPAGDLSSRLEAARRAVALQPQDPERVRRLAELLIDNDSREEARVLAASLGTEDGRSRAVADLLELRLLASEGRLGAAFAHAQQSLTALREFGRYPSDVELANESLRLAWILGRAGAAADAFVARFVDVDPPRVSRAEPDAALNIIAACAVASAPVSSRCFARLRTMLRDRLWTVGLSPGVGAALTGAEHYARGDLEGAAAAWRGLLVGTPGYVVFLLEDPMAQTFDRIGHPELAESADRDSVLHPGEYSGANLAYAREARRRAARGDRDGARALAQHVVDAWTTADVPVPAVADMNALLQTLR